MVERRLHGFFRLPMLESLQERQLMAADVRIDEPVTVDALPVVLVCQPLTVTERVTETTQSLDVDGDGRISNLDYLAILDHLNQQPNTTSLDLEGEATQSSDGIDSLKNVDVNADGQISPLDVLIVANRIQLYNPLTPCTCGACLGTNPGIRCEAAANASKAELASVELAPQWQP